MKWLSPIRLAAGMLLIGIFGCGRLAVLGAELELRVTPKFSGEPIQADSIRYENSARENLSVMRVSFLLSGFALQRPDGSWLELTNDVAWFDLERDRTTHRLAPVAGGEYRSLRFHVGLDQTLNHADPAPYPARHPLNPNLNGLHWNWQGGYIFLAMEGLWRNPSGAIDGWSYHFARDTNRVCVTLPASLSLTNDLRLELDFDVGSVLNAPRPMSFAAQGSSTHSRDGDPVSAAIAANLPGAFRLQRVMSAAASPVKTIVAKPLYLPEKFTPYRFAMSATFPIPDLPRDNPLTEERVRLGEKLFHDPRLSKDNSISCASCHDVRHAFADPRRYSIGVRGQVGTRNAMPLFNLAWKGSFFWDGRAPSLRAQALMPIQDHLEMAESLTNVVSKLSRGGKGHSPTNYAAWFTAAFGSPEISVAKISLALEAFVLTLTSFDSKFDRAFRGEATLTAAEQRGFELFMTEYDPRRGQFGADCFHCHGGALFSDHQFHNNGAELNPADTGRMRVTGLESDRGKFSTPSLRNVALTGPYFHDGHFQTLEEVVAHYDHGLQRTATLDPNLAKHPAEGLHLSPEDQAALVAFLKTLTDEQFREKKSADGR
ncbi:MAG: MbnP family protein [Verrucomicrobiota bacterium]